MDIKAKTLADNIPATSNPSAIHIKAGGVGRNIAHNIAKLGGAVSLLSVIGKDVHGDMLLAETAAAGVDVSMLLRVDQPSGIYLAILDHNGELISAANDMRYLTSAMIAAQSRAIATADFVIADCNLDDACLRAITHTKIIIEPVSVSKSKKLIELLQHREIYLATPNLDQIESLTGTRNPEAAAKILHERGLQNIVIHAGTQGAYVCDGKNFIHIPSTAQTIVDVTGAGDAATAGLVFGLMQNRSLEKSAELGQAMAARVIASHSSTLD